MVDPDAEESKQQEDKPAAGPGWTTLSSSSVLPQNSFHGPKPGLAEHHPVCFMALSWHAQGYASAMQSLPSVAATSEGL